MYSKKTQINNNREKFWRFYANKLNCNNNNKWIKKLPQMENFKMHAAISKLLERYAKNVASSGQETIKISYS